MRLSKQQAKLHNEACEILEQDVLTFDEKVFVLNNWNEGAEHINSTAGAFFTPQGLARDFQLAVYRNGRVIDLCAGIGSLSFWLVQQSHYESVDPLKELVCIEINPKYVEVGRKIVPEAKWINASALDLDLLLSLGRFNQAISNPPFGNVKTGSIDKKFLKYTGSEFEYKLIEIASKISDYGAFILPQMSTPWKYSGNRCMEKICSEKLTKFIDQTALEFQMNCGIDTSIYINDWRGVSPMCEVAIFDFKELAESEKQQPKQYSLF